MKTDTKYWRKEVEKIVKEYQNDINTLEKIQIQYEDEIKKLYSMIYELKKYSIIWIDVNDRLPFDDATILFLTDDGNVFSGIPSAELYNNNGIFNKGGKITHWAKINYPKERQ